jgi:hypothetical protein
MKSFGKSIAKAVPNASGTYCLSDTPSALRESQLAKVLPATRMKEFSAKTAEPFDTCSISSPVSRRKHPRSIEDF